MNISWIYNRIFPLGAGFGIGLAAVFICGSDDRINCEANVAPIMVESERGSGISSANPSQEFYKPSQRTSDAMRIVSKPRAQYTDEARQNNVQGKVVLRVVFLASGNIGSVEPISNLPDGLTEQAIEAAKRIQFEPKLENGRPVSSIKSVEYLFAIY